MTYDLVSIAGLANSRTSRLLSAGEGLRQQHHLPLSTRRAKRHDGYMRGNSRRDRGPRPGPGAPRVAGLDAFVPVLFRAAALLGLRPATFLAVVFRHLRLLDPRRARCRACSATDVLLPAFAPLRSAYAMEVVGPALLGSAQGRSHRKSARSEGEPSGYAPPPPARRTSSTRTWLPSFRPSPVQRSLRPSRRSRRRLPRPDSCSVRSLHPGSCSRPLPKNTSWHRSAATDTRRARHSHACVPAIA